MKLWIILGVLAVMAIATGIGFLALSDAQGRGSNWIIGAMAVDVLGLLGIIWAWCIL